MSSFSPQQQAFISTLAGHTGLNPGVIAAWVAAEEPVGARSGYHGTQDWLNVGITDSGPMGAGNSVWRDPTQAAIATANWIRGTWSDPGFGHAAPGIRAILHTAGQSPQAQISAIQNSGWASGGYSDLPSLYGTYGKSAPAASVAKQRAGVGGGVGQPAVSTSFSGGSTDWSSAGVAALMGAADKPIDMSGKVHTDNVLGRLINAVDSGQYTTPSQANTTLSSSPSPSMKQVAQNHALGRNGLVNPLAGFTGLSFDKGIDGSARPGTPIRAPAASTLVEVIPDFYKGQPLLLFKFDHPIPGAPTQYWFTSEQINPATRTIGTHFAGGQPVATFASSGTGMETGWGSPTTSDRRFAPVEAHYGQAHTGWGWHFAKFFGIG